MLGAERSPSHHTSSTDIKAHLAQWVGADAVALVFSSPDGSGLRRSNFNRRVWQPACRAAGLSGSQVSRLETYRQHLGGIDRGEHQRADEPDGPCQPPCRAHVPTRHFGARPRARGCPVQTRRADGRSPAETAYRASDRTAMFDQCSIGPFCAPEDDPPEGQKCWSSWWRRSDSNRRPPACKAGALPTELRPQYFQRATSIFPDGTASEGLA